jgi:hypothetical protein
MSKYFFRSRAGINTPSAYFFVAPVAIQWIMPEER